MFSNSSPLFLKLTADTRSCSIFSSIFICLFLVIVLLCCSVYSHETIDPTDMRFYDISTKTMRRSPPSTGESKAFESPTNDGNCTTHVQDLKKFEIFLERFINHLLSTANLMNKHMKPKTRISTEIPILITYEELLQLKKLSGKITAANLNEADALFSSVFTNDRGFSFDSLSPYLNPIEELFFNLSYEKITIVVFIMVTCVVMWMFAVGRELKKIIIFLYLTFFMGGLGWNWWKMYQEAVIEQYSEMQRLSQIPDVCVPKKVGIFEYIFSSSSAQEECRKYHTAFRFNALSKVPPTIVLSETVSGMLVYPLKSLGSSVGEFLTGVNNAASWPFKAFFLPFIFVTSLFALFCIVAVCLGVKLNFWTLFGGVSVGGRNEREAPNHPTVIDEISLRRTIEYDNENHYIITQVGTIRRCITAVKNETPMEPLENRNPPSTAKLRFPSMLKNLQNRGDKFISVFDSTFGRPSGDQNRQNQFTGQNGSSIVANFQSKNSSTPASNQPSTSRVDKNVSVREFESSFGSGDNLSRNSDNIAQSIHNHWNDVLQQLNFNITRRKPTPRIMNSRSVIHRRKNK